MCFVKFDYFNFPILDNQFFYVGSRQYGTLVYGNNMDQLLIWLLGNKIDKYKSYIDYFITLYYK